MARVTVEDCVTKIPNRFELVMLASQRARDISAGANPTVDLDDDKHPVIALREIAGESVTRDELSEALSRGLRRYAETDEPEDEPLPMDAVAPASEILSDAFEPPAGAPSETEIAELSLASAAAVDIADDSPAAGAGGSTDAE